MSPTASPIVTLIFPSLCSSDAPAASISNLLIGLDVRLALTPKHPHFLGFTHLPPGWHFVYAGAHAALSTRTGYWFFVRDADHTHTHTHTRGARHGAPPDPDHWIRILRWDAQAEDLEMRAPSSHEQREWSARLNHRPQDRDVHARLLPYDYQPDAASASAGTAAGTAATATATTITTTTTTTGSAPLPRSDASALSEADFRALTCYITPALLSQMTDPDDDSSSGTRLRKDADSGLWLIATSSCAPEDRDEIPGLDASDRTFRRGDGGSTNDEEGRVLGEERELRFLGINLKQTWREGAIGRERTIDARDRSGALERVVAGLPAELYAADGTASTDYDEDSDSESASETDSGSDSNSENDDNEDDDGNDSDDHDHNNDSSSSQRSEQPWGAPLLGEMQVCFLTVLLVANWSCLEEWRRIVELVLTCRAALVRRPRFFAAFLTLLRRQLQRCGDVEGGLFDVEGAEGAEFLQARLRQFREAVSEAQSKTESRGEEKSKGRRRKGGGGADVANETSTSTTSRQHPHRRGHRRRRIQHLQQSLHRLDAWLAEEWHWDVAPAGSSVRRGLVELEDGERVELALEGADEEEETGEYAPVIVDLDVT